MMIGIKGKKHKFTLHLYFPFPININSPKKNSRKKKIGKEEKHVLLSTKFLLCS